MVVVTGESDAAAGVGIAEGGSAIVPVVYDVLLSADVPSSKAQSEQTRPTKRRSISSVWKSLTRPQDNYAIMVDIVLRAQSC